MSAGKHDVISGDLRRVLTAPQTVALIGASDSPSKLTARPLTFLQKHGFSGRIYPVNPRRNTVMGLTAYKSIADVPEPVEHAYILLDAELAMRAFKECVDAGVKVVVMLADGFAESGAEGAARQDQLVAAAAAANVCLLGPNSMGVVDTRSGFVCTTNAAFAAEKLNRGRLSVISQSGSLIGTIVSRGQARGLSFATLVSLGNEASMGVGELGQILVDDPDTDGYLLFLETLRNTAAIAAFARRAHALGKPIVAYMVGQSAEGQALSVSHTGALVGSAAAAKSFLSHHGIHCAHTFETLLEAPQALLVASGKRARPATATVVTTTGGGGAMVVDQLSLRGVKIAGPSAATRASLQGSGIAVGAGKLLDVTLAGTRYETMKSVLATLLNDPHTGVVVAAIGSSAQFNPELAVRPVIDAAKEASKDAAPVLAFPLPQADDSLLRLAQAGVPAFRTVEACAESVAMLFSAQHTRGPAPDVARTLSPNVERALNENTNDLLNEVEAGELFQTLGISAPPRVVLQNGEATPNSLPFPYPCVAKIVSRALPHKTDAGAVSLALQNREALADAITRMTRSVQAKDAAIALEGVLIQPMLSGVAQLLLGITVDPLVGPVLSVGMGGVMTELYADVAVRPAPVSRDTAREMLSELKGFALLDGFRGTTRADTDAVADAMARLSQLAFASRVMEAEINPLLVREEGEGVVILDAMARLRPVKL